MKRILFALLTLLLLGGAIGNVWLCIDFNSQYSDYVPAAATLVSSSPVGCFISDDCSCNGTHYEVMWRYPVTVTVHTRNMKSKPADPTTIYHHPKEPSLYTFNPDVSIKEFESLFSNYVPATARIVSLSPVSCDASDKCSCDGTHYDVEWTYSVALTTRTINMKHKPATSTTIYYNPRRPSAYTLSTDVGTPFFLIAAALFIASCFSARRFYRSFQHCE